MWLENGELYSLLPPFYGLRVHVAKPSIMLSLFVSGACGFASVKVDPLCAACQISTSEEAGMMDKYSWSNLTPAGKKIMKHCVFTVFEECLAGGLGENTFCETVVSKSAELGWTEAEDLKHDKIVECALPDTPPLPH